jgi:hypothetical protein
MEWESGATPPGRALADMKIAGLRQLLDAYVADLDALADQDG